MNLNKISAPKLRPRDTVYAAVLPTSVGEKGLVLPEFKVLFVVGRERRPQ